MLGVFLVAVSTLIEEIGSSVGKYTILHKMERPYTTAFVSNSGAIVALLALGLLIPPNFFGPGMPGGFVFAAASLPTFLLRIVLEVVQSHVTLFAVIKADRSTFAFLRILTIPLLLVVDVVLGYVIHMPQMLGLGLIIVALVTLYANKGIEKRGSGLVLLSAVNAVATISLFKYDVSHFNSIAAEQSIVLAVIVLYFLVMALRTREHPFRHMFDSAQITQFLSGSISNSVGSFAILFIPPSVAIAAKRSLSVMWALGSGASFFKERHVLLKIIAGIFFVLGLALLVF